jgi:hypothetical protein
MPTHNSNFNTFANTTRTGSNQNWGSEEEAKISDNIYAVQGSPALPLGVTWTFHYLDCRQMVDSLPGSATSINGITINIERQASADTSLINVKDLDVFIIKGGSIQTGTNKADTATNWPTTDTVKTYGGASDLWGLTWTVADINDSGFGVVLACQGNTDGESEDTGAPFVDQISVTITYTGSEDTQVYIIS